MLLQSRKVGEFLRYYEQEKSQRARRAQRVECEFFFSFWEKQNLLPSRVDSLFCMSQLTTELPILRPNDEENIPFKQHHNRSFSLPNHISYLTFNRTQKFVPYAHHLRVSFLATNWFVPDLWASGRNSAGAAGRSAARQLSDCPKRYPTPHQA